MTEILEVLLPFIKFLIGAGIVLFVSTFVITVNFIIKTGRDIDDIIKK